MLVLNLKWNMIFYWRSAQQQYHDAHPKLEDLTQMREIEKIGTLSIIPESWPTGETSYKCPKSNVFSVVGHWGRSNRPHCNAGVHSTKIFMPIIIKGDIVETQSWFYSIISISWGFCRERKKLLRSWALGHWASLIIILVPPPDDAGQSVKPLMRPKERPTFFMIFNQLSLVDIFHLDFFIFTFTYCLFTVLKS